MKNINRITLVLLIVFGGLTSCNKDANTKYEDNVNFEESIAFIQHGILDLESFKSSEQAMVIELKDFSDEIELSPVYKINCIEYCDNGLFNDEIAGDGIYTSVEKFSSTNNKSSFVQNSVRVNVSDKFKYNEDLNEYINPDGFKKISMTCKVRLVECPNTAWYNTSIFGEPCVEFYDCEITVGT